MPRTTSKPDRLKQAPERHTQAVIDRPRRRVETDRDPSSIGAPSETATSGGGSHTSLEMTSHIGAITIDCHDPLLLAGFWSRALGYQVHPESGAEEALLLPGDDSVAEINFVRVPEEKTVKNRIHFDLVPEEPRDREVGRLLGLGASVVDDRRGSDGWVVMGDPEGNEFCVMQSASERP